MKEEGCFIRHQFEFPLHYPNNKNNIIDRIIRKRKCRYFLFRYLLHIIFYIQYASHKQICVFRCTTIRCGSWLSSVGLQACYTQIPDVLKHQRSSRTFVKLAKSDIIASSRIHHYVHARHLFMRWNSAIMRIFIFLCKNLRPRLLAWEWKMCICLVDVMLILGCRRLHSYST